MSYRSLRRRKGVRGHSVLEVAMLSPWIFFLFAGTLDLGFYSYALIATQNAARVAAEYTSLKPGTLGDSATACTFALNEMNTMPNLKNVSSCNSSPLVVQANSITDADGVAATSVSVTYTTNTLIPIPGLAGRMTITRTVQMKGA